VIAVTLLLLLLAQTPDDLVRQLGADDAAKREEAAKALEALGEKAIPALEAGAKSDDAEVKARCEELVLAVTQSRDFGARIESARFARTREAIGGWWRDISPQVSHTAYDNLLDYPDGKTRPADLEDVPYLLAILADPQVPGLLRRGMTNEQFCRLQALEALRFFPLVDDPADRFLRIVERVAPAVSDRDDPAWSEYAVDFYWQLCQVSQMAIRNATRERILAALPALARCKRNDVRRAVAMAAAAWKEPKARPILLALLDDTDVDSRRAAARALGGYDLHGAEDTLRRVLAQDQDPFTRVYAARALAQTGEQPALDALFAALDGNDAALHNAALDALRSVMSTPLDTSDPQKTAAEAWREWWKANHDRVVWDPEQQMFVAR